MFGNDLGENGVMKISRGTEEHFLDQEAVTFYPSLNWLFNLIFNLIMDNIIKKKQ